MKRWIPILLLLLLFSGCAVNEANRGQIEKRETSVVKEYKIVYKNPTKSINVRLLKNRLRVGEKLKFKIIVKSNYLQKSYYLPFELAIFKKNRRLARLKRSILINKKIKTSTITLPIKRGLSGKYHYELTFYKYLGVKREGDFWVK